MKMHARLILLLPLAAMNVAAQPKDDGYRGIWYSNQPSKDEYG